MAKKSSKTAHVLNLISSSASEQPQKAKEEKNEQKTPSPVQKIFEKTAKNEEISNRIKNGLLKELEKEAGMGGGLTAGKETADVIPGAAADISVKDTGGLSASLGDITDNDGTLPANTEDGFNDYTESPNKQDNTDSGGYDTQNSPAAKATACSIPHLPSTEPTIYRIPTAAKLLTPNRYPYPLKAGQTRIQSLACRLTAIRLRQIFPQAVPIILTEKALIYGRIQNTAFQTAGQTPPLSLKA